MIIYPRPKYGLFEICTIVYELPGGWIQKQQTIKIIGEEINHYIERTYVSEIGYWDTEGVRFEIVKHCAIGPHKTRLLRWTNEQFTDLPTFKEQLSLF